jgi:hypothetical protein
VDLGCVAASVREALEYVILVWSECAPLADAGFSLGFSGERSLQSSVLLDRVTMDSKKACEMADLFIPACLNAWMDLKRRFRI